MLGWVDDTDCRWVGSLPGNKGACTHMRSSQQQPSQTKSTSTHPQADCYAHNAFIPLYVKQMTFNLVRTANSLISKSVPNPLESPCLSIFSQWVSKSNSQASPLTMNVCRRSLAYRFMYPTNICRICPWYKSGSESMIRANHRNKQLPSFLTWAIRQLSRNDNTRGRKGCTSAFFECALVCAACWQQAYLARHPSHVEGHVSHRRQQETKPRNHDANRPFQRTPSGWFQNESRVLCLLMGRAPGITGKALCWRFTIRSE